LRLRALETAIDDLRLENLVMVAVSGGIVRVKLSVGDDVLLESTCAELTIASCDRIMNADELH
jgi:hypothetical protein